MIYDSYTVPCWKLVFCYIADTQRTIWSDEEFRIYGLTPGPQSPGYNELLAKYIHLNWTENSKNLSTTSLRLEYNTEIQSCMPRDRELLNQTAVYVFWIILLNLI